MDGTEKRGDALQATEQPSLGEQGTSKQAKSYTEQDIQKAVNDALAAKGRDAKTLSDKEAGLKADREAIEAKRTELAEWERRRDETELAEARRDPDKLAAWQKKQADKTRDVEFTTRETNIKKREADLAKREAEHEAEIKATQETQLEIKLWEIGAKHKLDPVILKDTMKDLNLTTVEQAEALAKRLTGQRPPEAEFNPVSGVTSGGHGEPTAEQLEKMPMPDYAAYAKKRDAKK